MFTTYAPLFVDGLADAALIFFVAVGLTLVFSVVRISMSRTAAFMHSARILAS